jgi:hypothetical protein
MNIERKSRSINGIDVLLIAIERKSRFINDIEALWHGYRAEIPLY